jgi:GT2 family glycosyltransferase
MVSADDVAVVIPVYNGVGIVDRCISALLRQSRIPGEIICVDDFSKDNTYEYIKRRFPDITLVRNGFNMGASGSYARGIRLALSKGYRLIWLLDQDSLPLKNALEELLSFPLVEKSVLTSLSVCPLMNYLYLPLDFTCGLFNWRRGNLSQPREILTSTFNGMLLPRKIINSVGFPSARMRNELGDFEFSTRIWLKGWRIIQVPSSIVYHIGGKPRLVPKATKGGFFKLSRTTRSIEYIHAEYIPVGSYSEERYFERGKNTALMLTSRIPNCAKVFMLRWIITTLAKIILLRGEYENYRKLRSYLRGILYGFIHY